MEQLERVKLDSGEWMAVLWYCVRSHAQTIMVTRDRDEWLSLRARRKRFPYDYRIVGVVDGVQRSVSVLDT